MIIINPNKNNKSLAEFKEEHYAKIGATKRANGIAATYYDNGNIKTEGQYKGGIKVGKWLEYAVDGKKVTTTYDTTGVIINTN